MFVKRNSFLIECVFQRRILHIMFAYTVIINDIISSIIIDIILVIFFSLKVWQHYALLQIKLITLTVHTCCSLL